MNAHYVWDAMRIGAQGMVLLTVTDFCVNRYELHVLVFQHQLSDN